MLKEVREVWIQVNIFFRFVYRIIFIKKMFFDKYVKFYLQFCQFVKMLIFCYVDFVFS